MTIGLTTWEELGRLVGHVLVIVNSTVDDGCAVKALFDELERRVALAAVHVIAEPAWRPVLAARGIADDHVLLTIDDRGREIELNHFLETAAMVRWAVTRRFQTIVGSAAHALYNEEVKDVLEQRVSLLIGDGRFLAHTLPGPYVFVFDLPALLQRASRGRKLEAYSASCRALIDDLCRLWRLKGAPTASDDADFRDVVDAVMRHLGPAAISFDEASAIPLPRHDTPDGVVALVKHLQQVLFERDQHLAALSDLYDERVEAVNARDTLIADLQAERVEAVNLRDTIIDELRREQETLTQRWRRKLRGQ